MKQLLTTLCLAALLLNTACSSREEAAPTQSESLALPATLSLSADKRSGKTGEETVLHTYRAGQQSPAYNILKSRMLAKLLRHWADTDLENISNPQWNYESFTEFHILDHNLQSVARWENLYYCAFTADNNKHGYVVLHYVPSEDGGGVGQVSMMETPYSFALEDHLGAIMEQLACTDIDMATVTASRVQLVDTAKNRSDQIILFTDSHGARYFCDLYDPAVEIQAL